MEKEFDVGSLSLFASDSVCPVRSYLSFSDSPTHSLSAISYTSKHPFIHPHENLQWESNQSINQLIRTGVAEGRLQEREQEKHGSKPKRRGREFHVKKRHYLDLLACLLSPVKSTIKCPMSIVNSQCR